MQPWPLQKTTPGPHPGNSFIFVSVPPQSHSTFSFAIVKYWVFPQSYPQPSPHIAPFPSGISSTSTASMTPRHAAPALHSPFSPDLHIQLSTVTPHSVPNYPESAPFHAPNLPFLCILVMPKKSQYSGQRPEAEPKLLTLSLLPNPGTSLGV